VPAICPYPESDQSSPLQTTSHFLKIQLNIILSFTPGPPKWSRSLRFPHQNPVYDFTLPHMRHMPTHLIFLDFITRIILGEENRSFSSSLCSYLHSRLYSSLLGTYIYVCVCCVCVCTYTFVAILSQSPDNLYGKSLRHAKPLPVATLPSG